MKRSLTLFLILAVAAVTALANVDTGLTALIPANSQLVAGIDVQKCRGSDFGQFLLSKYQASDANFDQFMTQTGFDPRRDLESVLLTTSGDGAGRQSSFAILARGNFDQSKIRNLALSKGKVTTETFQGVSLLIQKGQGQAVAIGFPDAGVAVMGDLASIHQVIQNLSNAASLDVDLMNRIAAVGKANDAWFVSTTGAAMLGKHFPADMTGQANGQMNGQMQALQSIRAASGGVVFGSNVAVTFDAATRSEQDATSLADVFRFMASMVQMQRQNDPRAGLLASALDNMQLKTAGDSVHLGFAMPEKNLEQMAELGKQIKH